eukprot:17417-Eustigmatos_ZCMA.PRE.1
MEVERPNPVTPKITVGADVQYGTVALLRRREAHNHPTHDETHACASSGEGTTRSHSIEGALLLSSLPAH